MTKTGYKAAALRAAEWLEANPDKHIRTSFARAVRNGSDISPLQPTAQYFCAVGRFIREANLGSADEVNGFQTLKEFDLLDQQALALAFISDRDQKDGIAALREWADGLPD